MPLRLCSILGMMFVLVLAFVPAAHAQKSKSKSKKAEASEETEASDDDALGEDAEDEEEWEEPDAWERPPAEEEAPPDEEPAAPVAEPVGDGRPISVDLVVGWAFNTDRNNGGLGANPYGLALGARGGYTLDFQLYAGAFFIYYLGGSSESEGGRGSTPSEATANYMHFGLEVGYDLWFSDILFRPGAQIGIALGIYEIVGATTISDSVADLTFNPGFALLYPMEDFTLGGDFRFNLVTGDGVQSVGLYVTGGMRFE